MFNQKNIIRIILLLTGIFLFKMPIEESICATPQMVYLIFSAGLLFWLCMKKANKYMAFLFLVAVLMTCKAYLHDFVPRHFLQQDVIFGTAMFGTYYAVRSLNIKKEMLKYLMFPALINCTFIFIQKLAGGQFPFPRQISGMVSNGGFTACFLALTVPIFFTYFKWGLIPLFFAMILCDGFVGMVAGIVALLFMIYYRHLRGKKIMPILLIAILALSIFSLKTNNLLKITNIDFNQRMSTYIGTLDGIKYHFVNGWGLGSFTSMMARVKPKDSRYYKNTPFNDSDTIISHPHNEFLYYWWTLGLAFMVGIILLIRDYLKKVCDNNIMPLAILVGAFIVMNGYQLKPPSLFILMFAMGIYENAYKVGKNKQCKNKEV